MKFKRRDKGGSNMQLGGDEPDRSDSADSDQKKHAMEIKIQSQTPMVTAKYNPEEGKKAAPTPGPA